MKQSKYTEIDHTISGIPPHYSLNVQFNFYKLGAWDREAFYVQANSKTGASNTYYTFYGAGQGQNKDKLCNIKTSFSFPVEFQITDINADNVDFSFKIAGNDNFGIREFVVTASLCYPSCLRCNGPNQTQCLSCIQNAAPPSCLCSPGFYLTSCGQSAANPCADTCTACHPSCKTCKGGSSTDCLTCNANFTLQSDGSCLSGCPTGKYMSGTQCLLCTGSCLSCTSATSCQSCGTTGGKPYLLNNSQCVASCLDGYIAQVTPLK